MKHPIEHTCLFYGYDLEKARDCLTRTNFTYLAKVTSRTIPNNDIYSSQETKTVYDATIHPITVDYSNTESETIQSILPPDYEPLEVTLLKEDIKELKQQIEMIKEVLGCNEIQIRNKYLATSYVNKLKMGTYNIDFSVITDSFSKIYDKEMKYREEGINHIPSPIFEEAFNKVKECLNELTRVYTGLSLFPYLLPEHKEQLFPTLIDLSINNVGYINVVRTTILTNFNKKWLEEQLPQVISPILAIGEEWEYRKVIELLKFLNSSYLNQVYSKVKEHSDSSIRELLKNFNS
jgi:hypothetical protein